MKLPRFDLNDWFATAEGRFDLSLSHSACETQAVDEILDDDERKSFTNTALFWSATIEDQYENHLSMRFGAGDSKYLGR